MRLAGNVIWFVFGGAFTALLWLLGAAVFALSIVGLPLTRADVQTLHGMLRQIAWKLRQ